MLCFSRKTVATFFLFLAGNLFAANTPVINFENILENSFSDSSGQLTFEDYTVAFAPDPPFNGIAAVVDPAGKVVAKFEFYPDYINSQGVFARIRTKAIGPAEVKLTEPGVYTLVFVVSGQPVTRMPVRLLQTSAGDDPFNPVKTFGFDGYWRTMAHFTTVTAGRGGLAPELTLWLGGMDLPPGVNRDMFRVALLRDGKEVAHSKRTQGVITNGHFKRRRTFLFHPHTEKESPNAIVFSLQDMKTNGAYEVLVSRVSDGKTIRSYDFNVVNGAITPLPQTVLGYQPATDYILPRVLKRGTTSLEMIEAIWIRDGG